MSSSSTYETPVEGSSCLRLLHQLYTKQNTSNSEEQTFLNATSPLLTNSKATGLITFESFLSQKLAYEYGRDEEDFLQNYYPSFIITSMVSITADNFSQVTSGIFLVRYSDVESTDIGEHSHFMVILRTYKDIQMLGYVMEKRVGTELTVMDHKDVKRKRNDTTDYKLKKKTNQPVFQESRIVNYSDNLKSITTQFKIHSANARKIKSSQKIGLYFQIGNQFLKIIHYFDNSSENIKGMNIVKGIGHDNISKILCYETKTINISQMRELFFEDFTNLTNYDYTIFITLSLLTEDAISSIGILSKQNCQSKLLCFVKIMLDAIDGINTLHENNIVHGDISINNIGFSWYSTISHTKYSKEKVQVAESIPLPFFDLVILDLNHCKVEGQEQATLTTVIEHTSDLNNIFYPFSTTPYCPTDDSLQFKKEHDIYSCALVLTQVFLLLFGNISHSQNNDWMKEGVLKERLLEELTKIEISNDDSSASCSIIKLLKSTIESEGRTDLCNFQKSFQLLNEHIIQQLTKQQ